MRKKASVKLSSQKAMEFDASGPNTEYFQSIEFLRNVLDTNPNLIFIKNQQGRFTLANQSVADIYGTSVEDLIGKTDADFNDHPDEVDWYCEDDQYVINERKSLYIPEEKVTSSNGETRWFETMKKPISMPDGTYQVLGVATDITERKELFEQLLQAQKMQGLGKLAGGIAHDFNNLLTVIMGYASVLQESEIDDPLILKAASGIEESAQKATDLIQKLLGFAREGKHLNVSMNVHDIVKETVSILSRTVEENITIKTQLEANDCIIQGDPVQIQQVILNLVINARDAMTPEKDGSDGGKLTIKTFNETKPIQNKLTEYLVIEFTDTGCGIDEEILSKVFEPFFTTKDASYGTGLGLAMVHGIVTNHQGEISVKSTPDKSTTFTVKLKASSNGTDGYLSNTNKVEIHENANYKVLLVDDNRFLLESTSLMLNSLGHEVVTADSAITCLEILRNPAHQIDLIILDMIMPKTTAEELLNEIFLLNSECKIIISTGYDVNLKVNSFLDRGVSCYMQKPYKKSELAKKIAEAMG